MNAIKSAIGLVKHALPLKAGSVLPIEPKIPDFGALLADVTSMLQGLLGIPSAEQKETAPAAPEAEDEGKKKEVGEEEISFRELDLRDPQVREALGREIERRLNEASSKGEETAALQEIRRALQPLREEPVEGVRGALQALEDIRRRAGILPETEGLAVQEVPGDELQVSVKPSAGDPVSMKPSAEPQDVVLPVSSEVEEEAVKVTCALQEASLPPSEAPELSAPRPEPAPVKVEAPTSSELALSPPELPELPKPEMSEPEPEEVESQPFEVLSLELPEGEATDDSSLPSTEKFGALPQAAAPQASLVSQASVHSNNHFPADRVEASARGVGEPRLPGAFRPERPSGSSEPVGSGDAAEFVDRIVKAARLTQSRGHARIRIALSPEHLGDLKIDLSVRQHVVTGKLQAESAAAKEVITARLDQLRETLASQGIQVGEFQVTVDQSFKQPQRDPEQHRPPSFAAAAAQSRSEESASLMESRLRSSRVQMLDLVA